MNRPETQRAQVPPEAAEIARAVELNRAGLMPIKTVELARAVTERPADVLRAIVQEATDQANITLWRSKRDNHDAGKLNPRDVKAAEAIRKFRETWLKALAAVEALEVKP